MFRQNPLNKAGASAVFFAHRYFSLILLLFLLCPTKGLASGNWAWHLETINWEPAITDPRWASGLSFGQGQGIAVFDTGIDWEHGLFTGRSIGEDQGTNLVADTSPLAPPTWQDGTGHGTAVASIAAGNEATLADANNTRISGTAKAADLWPVRVLDNQGLGSFAGINEGLAWVIHQVKEEDAPIRVVNMSLGTDVTFFDPDDLTGETVETFNAHSAVLRSLNIPIVAASGNSGTQGGISFPAIAGDVLSVGSSNQNDQISSFTNRGKNLDLLAPGESIWAAVARAEENDPLNLVGVGTGTSFAAPLVTGTILLINEVYEYKWGHVPTYDQIFDFVTFSETIIEEDDLAFPRLDVHASLERAYLIPEPRTLGLLVVAAVAWMLFIARRRST